LNWFMPALVKSSVGSSPGTSGELGTMRWPLFSKNFRNEVLISLDVIGSVMLRLPSRERREDALGVEPLADQIAVQASGFALVRDCTAAAQPFPKRLLEERIVVFTLEGGVDGTLGERTGDARALDFSPHSSSAAPFQRHLRPRNRAGDALVVERPLVAEACDRFVDGVGLVAVAREALPHLRFGELASREQLEAVDVGPVSCQTS
jgi:hypothetical protein